MNVAADSKVYTYAGSLTTPPCSEGVTWYVVEDVLSMSVTQFQAWKNLMKFNSRVTQNAPGLPNLIELAAGKGAEEKPTEEKPTEEKPTEEKPVEEKPTEETPVEEKPVEEKPTEETPVEEK